MGLDFRYVPGFLGVTFLVKMVHPHLLWVEVTPSPPPRGKEYFCMNCLQGFKEESSKDEHMRYCLDNETVKVEMPHKKPIVEFCNGQYQFKVPFIMYADFESLLEPIRRSPGPCGAIQEPSKDPSGPLTIITKNHIPSGWCVYSEFAYGKVKNPLTLYRGKNCVKKFCDHIIGEAYRAYRLYRAFPELPMNPLTSNLTKDIRNRRGVTFAFDHSRKKIQKSEIIAIILEIIEELPTEIVICSRKFHPISP